jgi:UDPglucose--hexose-1-phosphate uridylyltransferase
MTKQKSEIRKSYLLNKYVIITPGRAKRPRDVKEKTVAKKDSFCPFCPENIDKKNIVDKIGSEKNWKTISVKNIFPAVTLDNKNAYGTQEVIIDNKSHEKQIGDLSLVEIENILKLYAKRTKELAKNKNINYILCFKNQGSKAGASLTHSHSQVFATKITPPDLIKEAKLAQDYKIKNKKCPYCDIIKKEIKSKRKIYSDKYFAAFTPYASEYHYEAWIFPKRHLDNISLLKKEEFISLSKTLSLILKKLQKIDLSFNFFLHNVVSLKNQHFYIKIQPRDSVWAGVELGSGLVINSIPPEIAAKYYRD